MQEREIGPEELQDSLRTIRKEVRNMDPFSPAWVGAQKGVRKVRRALREIHEGQRRARKLARQQEA